MTTICMANLHGAGGFAATSMATDARSFARASVGPLGPNWDPGKDAAREMTSSPPPVQQLMRLMRDKIRRYEYIASLQLLDRAIAHFMIADTIVI